MSIDRPGDRIKKLIKRDGLSQKQFMEKFNKQYGYTDSESTISQYVNNKRTPEIDKMIKIADFFNVTLDYIMCRTDKDVDLSIYNLFKNEYYIAENIKNIRKKKNISIEELSKLSGLSLVQLKKIENQIAIPNEETIFLLAEKLNCTISEIVQKSNKQYDSVIIKKIINIMSSDNEKRKQIIKEVIELNDDNIIILNKIINALKEKND
ncbi:helix-turn-helix domain-containing protein [Thomasclavelia cocleata]|uniref:helix-turn-helix domain-containing protein n=1 Tax=Thomasclavelia cocleata TaxID=69824 RepID=UPI00242D8DF2|nr:helix-turn-helix transcriptional regulator [Thomasclavelia cocleata]